MVDLYELQEKILAHMRANIDTPIYRSGVPDEVGIRRNDAGKVTPYIAVQFGSVPNVYTGKSFGGVRGDDFDLNLYVQVVAADSSLADKISHKVVWNTLLGYEPQDNGEMEPIRLGAALPVNASNGATEAYMAPSSYGVSVQMLEQ